MMLKQFGGIAAASFCTPSVEWLFQPAYWFCHHFEISGLHSYQVKMNCCLFIAWIQAALKEVLQEIKSDLPWIERMDLTVCPTRPPNPLLGQLGDDPDDLSGDEIHNDVKREMKL